METGADARVGKEYRFNTETSSAKSEMSRCREVDWHAAWYNNASENGPLVQALAMRAESDFAVRVRKSKHGVHVAHLF